MKRTFRVTNRTPIAGAFHIPVQENFAARYCGM